MSYLGLETVKPIKPMKRGDLYSFPITTIDQIVTDEKTNERLPEYLDKNFGMDLLWTNASPTSPFNAQTISLNLTNYKVVLIQCWAEPSNVGDLAAGAYSWNEIPVGETGSITSSYAQIRYRQVKVTTSGCVFDTGYGVTVFNQSASASDHAAIPLKIYGIK